MLPMTRTYGDVYMHVSEFEYFVDGTPPPPDLAVIDASLAAMDAEKREGIRAIIAEVGVERIWPLVQYLQRVALSDLRVLLGITPPPAEFKAVAGYLSELVEDGVTIQIGVGDPSSQMPRMGAFDGKHDLGLHTEMCAPGIARLVDAGIINGRRKTIHRGKAVAVAWSGSDPDDLRIIDDNPAFELYDPEYVLKLATVAANYRQTSINNALAIDLTGQINSESLLGARMMNGTGGQPETHIGAFLCPGGRAITCCNRLRSAARFRGSSRNSKRRAGDGAALLRGYRCDGIRNRAVAGKEPSRACRRIDRDCASRPSRRVEESRHPSLRVNFADFAPVRS